MLAWLKPSDFDAMRRTGVSHSGRSGVVSNVFPMWSHYATVVVARLANGQLTG
jgi:hypothetical protein